MITDTARLFFTDSLPLAQRAATDSCSMSVPTLLIHGWLCDSDDWIYQLPALRQRCRTIAVDLRGHGRSSAPPDGYSPQIMAADVAALLENLEVDRVVVMAHSSGAEVAVALASQIPEAVHALIAVDPSYGLPEENRARFEEFAARLAGPQGAEVASAHFASIETASTPDHLKEWHVRRPLGAPQHVLQNTMREFALGPEGLRLQPQSDRHLLNRQAPVLSFHRDHVRAEADLVRCINPSSSSLVYSGSGHWLHQEQPERFTADVERWLLKLDGKVVESD
ncbi:putative esterase/lipase HI_0193 [Arthrobacter sp. Hiyo1]|uniref:alpha/beta fold hydrolase n=1 Tax=Arthrobacter sp. Hiyo1 TaxID=1588020 RepID=UPI0006A38475|nr:alpha/beta hydrolase [Arthrobacter sp. Hiyo1]GAP61449.1 putative esterase/lipase HI_0193 [Arthrobacter sp. Hiyo1]